MTNSKYCYLILSIVVLAIFGGLGYWASKNQATPATSSTAGKTDETTDWQTYENKDLGVSFKYPKNWGELISPPVDQFGKITEGIYKDKFYGISETVEIDPVAKHEAVFSQYPDKFYLGVPSIGTYKYPESFKDDEEEGPGQMNKEDKEQMIESLIKMFNQRSLNNISLAQKIFSGEMSVIDVKTLKINQTEQTTTRYFGGWWGNRSANQDRINTQYLESKDSNLRGVGYMAFEGQDVNLDPVYYVVLINPNDRLIVEMYLPIPNSSLVNYEKEFEKAFDDDRTSFDKNNPDTHSYQKSASVVKKLYDYLEKKNRGDEIENFVNDISIIVKSVKYSA